MDVAGLVLAAGAGRRMGTPKGLLTDPDGRSWAARAAVVLLEGGCSSATVVVGARAAQVAATLPKGVAVVEAPDWAQGMGASLRAGLAAVPASADAVLVALVDMPDVGVEVVRRLLAGAAPRSRDALVRAAWDGRPGNPLVLGRGHVRGVVGSALGDVGARAYLAGRDDVAVVECGDLGTGADLDRPEDLPGWAGGGSGRA